MKCRECECEPSGQFYKTFFVRDLHIFLLSQSVCQTRPQKLTNDKHSSLLWKPVIYGQKSFITLGPGANLLSTPNYCGRIHNTLFSLQLMNSPTKLEHNISLCWQSLKGTNTLVFRAYSQVTKKMKCCEYDPRSYSSLRVQLNYWGRIHNTLFSLQLMNGHNKREHNITLCWQCVKGTKTLVFRTYSQVTKKMKCCEYDPWSQSLFNAQFNFLGHIYNTLQPTNRPNKL